MTKITKQSQLVDALMSLQPGSLSTREEVERFREIIMSYVNQQDQIIDDFTNRIGAIENEIEMIYADDITKMTGLIFIEHKGLDNEFLEFLTNKVIEKSRNGEVQ